MKRNSLLLLPFLFGLALMIYSWYVSYPLLTTSANDFIFNHVSIYYWFSLPFLLVSMFLMAITAKNNLLKWILTIGLILTFYSLSYFYCMVPGVDSQYFRGLSENFIKTQNLDASQLNHFYYQWPALFILNYIATAVSGSTIITFEFLLYALIGVLLTTALFVYASKIYRNTGFLVVAAFFLSIFYFLNYQAVPYTLALGLLFLIFMLTTEKKSLGLTTVLIVLYMGLLVTHLFVPVFFIIYFLAKTILERSRRNVSLITFALVSYFVVQLTLAKFSFSQIIASVLHVSKEYFDLFSTTVALSSVPVDVVAQALSRTVTILSIILCVAGFIFLLVKRKMSVNDKAILVSGVVYTVLGAFLNTIGWRALAVAFIPISMGVALLFISRFSRFFKYVFLLLLILFLFIPLHQSFNQEIQFQTRDVYIASNFFIDHYQWEKPGSILTGFRVETYIQPKLNSYTYINRNPEIAGEMDTIFYTLELAGNRFGNNSTFESFLQNQRLNIVYNDGVSNIATKVLP
jgi:hypothetical protein